MPIGASAGTLDIENATLRSNAIAVLTNMVAGNDQVRQSGPPALEVYGDPSHGGNEPRLELVSNITDTVSNSFTRLTSNAGVFSIETGTNGTSDNGTITFGGFQNERLRITSDGKVGVGTTNPTTKFTLYGDNTQDEGGLLMKVVNRVAFDNGFTGIGLGGYATTTAPIIQVAKSAIIHERTGYNGTGNLMFCNDGTTDNNDVSNTHARMTITSTGDVGIGTTSPSSQLELYGAGKDLTFKYDTGISRRTPETRDAYYSGLENSIKRVGDRNVFDGSLFTPDTTHEILMGFSDTYTQYSNSGYYYPSYNEMRFKLWSPTSSTVGSLTDVLTLRGDGNVGIGATDPDAKLDVRTGDIRFGDNVADYEISGFVDEYGGITVHSSSGNLGYNISTGNSTESWCWRFVDSTAKSPGTDYFRVEYPSGDYYHKGTSISDRRTKTNFVSIDGVDALNSITKLNPLVYNDKTSKGGVDNRLKGGFIAQEVLDVIPHLVSCDKDRDKPNENGYATAYALDYNGVFTYNVKATQEIYKLLLIEQTKVTNLEARILALESA